MNVAIVTDTTAYLPSSVVAERGIRVVPLHVVVAGQEFSEGVDISTAEVAAALRAYKPVSTSRRKWVICSARSSPSSTRRRWE